MSITLSGFIGHRAEALFICWVGPFFPELPAIRRSGERLCSDSDEKIG
jgi:hypothetical protein